MISGIGAVLAYGSNGTAGGVDLLGFTRPL